MVQSNNTTTFALNKTTNGFNTSIWVSVVLLKCRDACTTWFTLHVLANKALKVIVNPNDANHGIIIQKNCPAHSVDSLVRLAVPSFSLVIGSNDEEEEVSSS